MQREADIDKVAIRAGRHYRRFLALFPGLFLALPQAEADEMVVAVATNFAEVMERLEAVFESESGHELTVVSGSTGKLFAQITNGAPFDLFLAADQARPRRVEQAGLAVSGSRFTYATGRLVLWSPSADHRVQDGAETLHRGDFRKLAIANPALAPYGAAAIQTLEVLGLYEALRPHLVYGENVGQAFAMVATGNADLGFVSLSFVISARNDSPGSRWEVPQSYYEPIRQDGVLLSRASGNRAATELQLWLKTKQARNIIERFGYSVE